MKRLSLSLEQYDSSTNGVKLRRLTPPCSSPMNASPLSLHADFILTHGRLITLDPARPTAPAIAIRDGTILAIGADEDMLRLAGPGACVVNLAGRTVIPGLIDADTEQIARIRDLLTASAESLAATSATMTIVGGRVVHD